MMHYSAQESRSIGATVPELHLMVTIHEDELPRRCDSQMMEHLLDTAIFTEVVAPNSFDYRDKDKLFRIMVGGTPDGIINTVRAVEPHKKGRHRLKTANGEMRYDYFSWVRQPITLMGRRLIPSLYCVNHVGMIQHGHVDESVLREAAKGLPFEQRPDGTFGFAGPRDAIRAARTYRASSWRGPTWGVIYEWSAYRGARVEERCGGFLWPDQAAAEAAKAVFLETGERQECWTCEQLQQRFPDHPVTAKVWEAHRNAKVPFKVETQLSPNVEAQTSCKETV